MKTNKMYYLLASQMCDPTVPSQVVEELADKLMLEDLSEEIQGYEDNSKFTNEYVGVVGEEQEEALQSFQRL